MVVVALHYNTPIQVALQCLLKGDQNFKISVTVQPSSVVGVYKLKRVKQPSLNRHLNYWKPKQINLAKVSEIKQWGLVV